jgi:hypothetical protein
LLLYLAEFADAEGKPVDPVRVTESLPATTADAPKPEPDTPTPVKSDDPEPAPEKPDAAR